MTVAIEDDSSLTRPQRRLLRRIFNGRTIPIIVGGKPFVRFKDASQYLASLDPQARNAAYDTMKEQAKSQLHDD